MLAAFANYSKLAPKAKKKKKQKLPKVVVNPKNVPKWQAAQDVLDRGKKVRLSIDFHYFTTILRLF